MSDALTSKPPLPALYWYHEFLAWAAHPAENGYVPVHPDTLRTVATILLEHHRCSVPPSALRAGDRVEWRGHLGTVTATGVVRVTLDSGHHHTLPVDQLSVTKDPVLSGINAAREMSGLEPFKQAAETNEAQCNGNCFLVGGPFVAEDPSCPKHGNR